MSAFERIAGYEKEKNELRGLAEIFNNRKKYELKGATLPKGIIFYGEPGTGKTLFAEVLATESCLKKITIDLSDTESGTAICAKIRKAFLKGARGHVPVMIFFDELDKLLPNRSEEYYSDRSKSILTQLLTLIDGMGASNNVVFVATCNDYEDLPESLVRPGRFDKKIGLGLPDLYSRHKILELYVNASPARFALSCESIAKLSSGFSCAALKTLVNECLLRSDSANLVSEELIRQKLREIKEEDLPTERSVASYTIDAVRNVASFLLARSYSNSNYLLTTEDGRVCNNFLDRVISGADDGDDYDEEYEEREPYRDDTKAASDDLFSKNDYLAAIMALLGGMAAEELLFGKLYDNLEPGLRAIDNLLKTMANHGFFGLHLLSSTYRFPEYKIPDALINELHAIYQKTVEECYEKAKSSVEKNKGLIERLANALIRKKSMEKEECEALIAEGGGIAV
ncbi:MAG: AAA family ATPase [Clostridia bacterium]|nr:AAA family ATPase [Clostridia bacterium]